MASSAKLLDTEPLIDRGPPNTEAVSDAFLMFKGELLFLDYIFV
jgi:hypothetical protein